MWVDLESLSWWLQFVLTVAGVVGVVVVPVWRMLRKSKKGQAGASWLSRTAGSAQTLWRQSVK